MWAARTLALHAGRRRRHLETLAQSLLAAGGGSPLRLLSSTSAAAVTDSPSLAAPDLPPASDAPQPFADAGANSGEPPIPHWEGPAAGADDDALRLLISAVESAPDDQVATAVESLGFDLTSELVTRVAEGIQSYPRKLLAFCKFAAEKHGPAVISPKNVELIVHQMFAAEGIDRDDAYTLYAFVQNFWAHLGALDPAVVNKLIRVFVRHGLAIGMLMCVRKMMLEEGSLLPEEKAGDVVRLLCKHGRAAQAHRVYLVMKEKGVPLRLQDLDLLIHGLLKYDDLKSLALELLDEYEGVRRKYSGKTFAFVMYRLCRSDDLGPAKDLLMKMVNLGPPPGSAVFNMIISALSRVGDMEEAKGMLRLMESRGIHPDVYSYSVVMSGFIRGGAMDEARELLIEAQKRHPERCRICYEILIRGYCRMEQFDKSLECLREMRNAGLQPRFKDYDRLARSLCLKSLDWETAERVLEEMEESGYAVEGATRRSLVSAVKSLEEQLLASAQM